MFTTNQSVSITRDNASTVVNVGEIELLFSYETVVAFRLGYRWYASENMWSQTTGKHLNSVSDKRDRIPHEKFIRALDVVMGQVSVAGDGAEVEIESILS